MGLLAQWSKHAPSVRRAVRLCSKMMESDPLPGNAATVLDHLTERPKSSAFIGASPLIALRRFA